MKKFDTLRSALSTYQTINTPLQGRINCEFWSIRETYRCILGCNEADEAFGRGNYGYVEPAPWRLRFPRLAAACDTAALIVNAALCDVFGHKFEDVGSYAGPEGAAEHFCCSRCGTSFHHTYF